jgi:hypothetical protein
METANETVLKKKGRTKCCVPLCKRNSMKNPELSFHQFPRESSLKETWLNLLGIQKQPLKSHKVCSLHFPGGKKVFNSLPTTPMSSYKQTTEKCNRDGQCIKACVQCGLVVNAELHG